MSYCLNLSGCSNVANESSADWASGFVVWFHAHIYQERSNMIDRGQMNTFAK